MLPIYISYFAGDGEDSTKKALTGTLGFVLGFTAVFTFPGGSGRDGGWEYQTTVNLLSGLVVIFFGLFKVNLLRGSNRTVNTANMGFFSAMLFGIVFSIGWTPCVGAFLDTALIGYLKSTFDWIKQHITSSTKSAAVCWSSSDYRQGNAG